MGTTLRIVVTLTTGEQAPLCASVLPVSLGERAPLCASLWLLTRENRHLFAPRYDLNTGRTGTSLRLIVSQELRRTGTTLRRGLSPKGVPGYNRVYHRVYPGYNRVYHRVYHGGYPSWGYIGCTMVGIPPGVHRVVYWAICLPGVYKVVYWAICLPGVCTGYIPPCIYAPCTTPGIPPIPRCTQVYLYRCTPCWLCRTTRPWAQRGETSWVRASLASQNLKSVTDVRSFCALLLRSRVERTGKIG